MYEQSARLYDRFCAHLDYEAASTKLIEVVERLAPGAETLLDVGCGTGRHLERLSSRYQAEGVDRSAEMLAIAAERCPGVPLHQGDLIDFELDGSFDVVCCLFGTIAFAKTREGLDRATSNLAQHLSPGGALVVEPWLTRDRFADCNIVFDAIDDPELKAARIYVARREKHLSIYDIHYLVGGPDGVDHFTERQELGLYTDEDYVAAVEGAGLKPVDPGAELFGLGLYAGVRPGADDDGSR